MNAARQALCASLLVAFAATAQEHREQITVSIIEVPVYVERLGKAVTGLTKEDFELYVNGTPHSIDYFDVLGGEDEPADQAIEIHRRRLILLLFDTVNSHPFVLERAKVAAAKFISEAPVGDTFAVATVGRSGIRFIAPFTTESDALRAVKTLKRPDSNDPLGLATKGTASRQSVASGEGAVGDMLDTFGSNPVVGPVLKGSMSGESPIEGTDLEGVSKIAASTSSLHKNEAVASAENDRTLMESLGALADRLAPLSGVKHVVLIAGGSSGNDEINLLDAVRRMHARYRAAGIILDAIDVANAGNVPGPRSPAAAGRNPLLETLTTDTGGSVWSSLPMLRKMQRETYVLSFHPDSEQKGQNDIVVKLKKASWGTVVRHRRGYTVGGPTRSTKGDGLFLADVLLNDIPQNGLTLETTARVEGGKVNVSAAVPGLELLARPTDAPVVLDFFVYIFDERNLVAGWSHDRMSIDTEKGREFLVTHPYALTKEFDLKAGRYVAKTLVRIVGTELTGFRRSDFVVTAPTGSTVARMFHD